MLNGASEASTAAYASCTLNNMSNSDRFIATMKTVLRMEKRKETIKVYEREAQQISNSAPKSLHQLCHVPQRLPYAGRESSLVWITIRPINVVRQSEGLQAVSHGILKFSACR